MPIQYSDKVLKFEPTEDDVAGSYTYKLQYYYAGAVNTTVYYEMEKSFIVQEAASVTLENRTSVQNETYAWNNSTKECTKTFNTVVTSFNSDGV